MGLKYLAFAKVRVLCETTEVNSWIVYSVSDLTEEESGYIISRADEWMTLRRDIQADFTEKHPEKTLVGIKKIRFQGNGLIDNIALLDYADADHDLIPDALVPHPVIQ